MASTSFNTALAFTLEYEGGKVNHPRDPGGRTNQGVTQKTFDAWRYSHGAAVRDVYTMTPAERDDIYKRGYWDKVTGDSLPPGVDLAVFDYAVNSGPARALRVFASVGRSKKPAEAIRAICASRLSFLRALRTWSVFGKGWARRVAACEVAALKLAGAPLYNAHIAAKDATKTSSSVFAAMVAAIGTVVASSWETLPGWIVPVILGVTVLFFAAFLRHRSNLIVRTDAIAAATTAPSSRPDLAAAVAAMRAMVAKITKPE